MKKKVCMGMCLFMLGLVGSGLAKVYIYIDAPATSKFPIAVPRFQNMNTLPDKDRISTSLATVISQDLEVSGLFRLIDPATFLENPVDSGITSDRINWNDWSLLGAEALIRGGFFQEEKGIRIETRLFDVIKGSFIAGKRYFGNADDLRLISHKFSDEVMYRLTGQKGIFLTKIAFVSDRSGKKEIYLMDYDGHNLTQVTNHRSITLSPAWSPDGKKIIFTSYKKGNPDVFMRELFYGRETRISHYSGLNIAPAWSPDDKKIVLTLSQDSGNSDIYIINLKGEKIKRLTSDWANDVSPCWSPDGREIAFVSNRSGSPQIYTMEVTSKKIKRLTYEGSYNTSPAWSPKGDKIAFAGMRDGSFAIYTINPDGSGLRQVTPTSESSEDPSWSPNGRHIVFSSNRSGRKKVCIMLADGSDQKMVTTGMGNDTNPCWSPFLEYR
jgi:TolB protein